MIKTEKEYSITQRQISYLERMVKETAQTDLRYYYKKTDALQATIGHLRAEIWEYEREKQYREWQEELQELLNDPDGDENTSYRIQCLQADIFAYQSAKEAIECGDEWMPENPWEAGLERG